MRIVINTAIMKGAFPMPKRNPTKQAEKAPQTPKTAPQEPIQAPASEQKPGSRPVGRPSLGLDKKARLNLTVTREEQLALDYLRSHTGKSVSELIGAWAIKESRRISKKTGKPVPTPDQMTMDGTT